MPQPLVNIILVAAGGAIGAVTRYGISGLAHTWFIRFPAGTLIVNTAGCFAIGLLMYFVLDRPTLSPNMRLFLMIGILGGMTTFSTFGYETLTLAREGRMQMVILNIMANITLALGAVWAGLALARLLWR
jgi:fluoride exporter